MTEISPHLGGYIPGGDPATYYPDLWRWLVEDYGLMTIADVGCGDGKALDYFWSLGAAAVGFEGTPQPDPQIVLHDYTVGPVDEYARPPYAPWDLVWSCEFVEHVEERYIANFLHTFALGRVVLMTHAEPGQQGHHHVNCRTADYWKGVLAAIGFQFDEQLTVVTRELASINDNPYNHYRRSGLAFRRFE